MLPYRNQIDIPSTVRRTADGYSLYMEIRQTRQGPQATRTLPNTVSEESVEAPTLAASDSIQLGDRDNTLDLEVGKLYTLYRNSNSRSEQSNLRRQIEQTLDSGRFGKDEKLQSLVGRLFEKNENAWRTKQQASGGVPGTSLEYNVKKFEVAGGQLLSGQTIFKIDSVRRLQNLAPLLSGAKPAGSAKKDLNHDLELLSSTPMKSGGSSTEIENDLNLLGGAKISSSAAERVRRDLDLCQAASTQAQNGFQRHLLNRLA